ncbi:MAG: energy transducer TonB [Sphingobacteriales bacterium]|nr:MAG: energy transducer TonB [Sphingobacteriales bacterium]
MRPYFFLFIFLLLSVDSYAQLGGMNSNMNGMNMMNGMNGRGGRGGNGRGRQQADDLPTSGSSEVFMVVEQAPTFPGDSLQAFLTHNLQYPLQAKKDSVEGRVVVMMIVHRDGSHEAPDVVRSSGNDELDAEALRVVRLMPKWIPGRQDNKDVDAYAKVPVVFSLQ